MPRPPEDLGHGSEKAWDVSDWHGSPACTVSVVPNGSGGLYIYCSTHHVISDAEAVGVRLNHQASKK